MFSAFVKYVGRSYHSHAEATRSAAASISDRSGRATSTGSAATADADKKSFSQVAVDTRKFLDAAYQKLGKVADAGTSDQEWHGAIRIQTLDRRALYAITTNHGGLFSATEVKAAKAEVASIEARASRAANPRGTDAAGAAKATITVLDGAGPEEKASLDWAQKRAAAQVQYQGLAKERHQGRAAVSAETDNPVVNHFVKAYGEAEKAKRYAQDGASIRVEDMPSWSKGVSLWNSLHEPQAKVLGHL
ncbi:hypothetical protein QO001_000609 [Methylobacterium brachiatum]|jgi:hypothetical protein|uniref:Uncharacterized protein n=1 Tax=Methylobacterium brachiatum TaxID=269660 RepID=A0AAJ1TNL7_9HYPH|nr:hypothetical protein [Methylobacterium brachiatum]MCB4800544.1 hypothetical protein [Methylobacterium brachiatum]MDQ0541701.1 hypothetical protein [Methylobacterium brachiatum]